MKSQIPIAHEQKPEYCRNCGCSSSEHFVWGFDPKIPNYWPHDPRTRTEVSCSCGQCIRGWWAGGKEFKRVS